MTERADQFAKWGANCRHVCDQNGWGFSRAIDLVEMFDIEWNALEPEEQTSFENGYRTEPVLTFDQLHNITIHHHPLREVRHG